MASFVAVLGWFCAISCFLVPPISTQEGNQSDRPESITEHISRKLNGFGFEFQKSLVKTGRNDANVLYSPLSLFMVFSMVCLGAKEETRKQMVEALNWTNDEEFLTFMIPWFQSISFNNDQLSLANKVWVMDQATLLPQYKEMLDNYFNAEIGRVDIWNPRRSENVINDWVSGKTNKNIRNLLPAGSVNMMTRLVLVNAVYFKGSWEQQFDKGRTKKGIFCLQSSDDKCIYNARYVDQVPGDNQLQVDYMSQTGQFFMASIRHDREFYQILEMPYGGNAPGEFCMYFLLPPNISSMQNLEKIMTLELLQKWIAQMSKLMVHVTIPKFSLKRKINLDGKLMNMTDLFSPKSADLSGINNKKDLFVSKAMHEVKISVDEEGTEAAAATGVIIQTRSGTPEFMVNRPFLFFIIHKPSKAIIFQGKVSKPQFS